MNLMLKMCHGNVFFRRFEIRREKHKNLKLFVGLRHAQKYRCSGSEIQRANYVGMCMYDVAHVLH
jgi:hypothetical protein